MITNEKNHEDWRKVTSSCAHPKVVKFWNEISSRMDSIPDPTHVNRNFGIQRFMWSLPEFHLEIDIYSDGMIRWCFMSSIDVENKSGVNAEELISCLDLIIISYIMNV